MRHVILVFLLVGSLTIAPVVVGDDGGEFLSIREWVVEVWHGLVAGLAPIATYGPFIDSSGLDYGPVIEPSGLDYGPMIEPNGLDHGPVIEPSGATQYPGNLAYGPMIEPSGLSYGPVIEPNGLHAA